MRRDRRFDITKAIYAVVARKLRGFVLKAVTV